MPTATLSPAQQDQLIESSLHGRGDELVRTLRIEPAALSVDALRAGWARSTAAYPQVGLSVRRSTGSAPQPVVLPVGALEPAGRLVLDRATTPIATLRYRADGAGRVQEVALQYHPVALDDRSARAVLVATLAPGADAARPSVDDYTAWLDGIDEAALETFWRAHLAPVDGPTLLRPDEPGSVAAARTLRRPVDQAVATAARRTADGLGAPIGVIGAGAWAAVVAGFRADPVAVIGALVDVRPPHLSDAIGPFETVLPLVAKVDATPAGAWLGMLATTIAELIGHGHVASGQLHRWSGTRRGAALFDSVVDLRPILAPDGSQLTRPQTVPIMVGYDGDEIRLDFDPARVPEDVATGLIDALSLVLGRLVSDPDTEVDAIGLVSADQREALLARSITSAIYPADRCLHQLVEEQAAATPHRIAVTYLDRSRTYAELNQDANRLAHHLRTLGVGPDSIVGLCSLPGHDMVTGILAILKAGGAYAPLDPAFPDERLSYLARDMACDVVLSQSDLAGRLPSLGQHLVPLDAPGLWSDQPDTNPDTGVSPANLSYVMYTSGSTGRPKGVLIEHRGAVNFVWWMVANYRLGDGDAALQWTAYSFDAAVWELFWPLCVGARAVLAPPKLHLDLDAFLALIERENVATLHFVPAVLQVFLAAIAPGRCASLRHVFCSGEPIPATAVERFNDVLDAELINLYGVTEVSIDSTFWSACDGSPLPFAPAGRPIANTAAYVLDKHLRPVPAGARGEVYLGGASVTRGYLRRPELTAERFVPDPYGLPGARLYRTGDIATQLADGTLVFHGRSDHQVKIRGIRIELPSIEAELGRHPAVRECMVLPQGEGGTKSLVAYVITRKPVRREDLREYLVDRLPLYEVPSAFVFLDAFPLNSNGKVDRAALPLAEIDALARQPYVAPSTCSEREVAAIWGQLLGRDDIGVHEDFFAAGGTSLLATSVIAQIRRRFEIELPVRAWLESRSVADLAAAVDRQLVVEAETRQLLDELGVDGATALTGVTSGD